VWFTYTQFSSQPGIEIRGAQVTGLGQVGALSLPELAPNSANGSFGDVSVGPNGQVFIVYQDHIPTEGPSRILGNLDSDGFGPAGLGSQVLIGKTKVGGFDYIPAQAGRSVDAETGLAWDRSPGPNHGRLYLIYTDENPNESDNTNILLRASDDDGANWSNPVKVSDDVTNRSQLLPRIALDQSTGFVAATWHDARSDAGDHGPGDTNGHPNDDVQMWGTLSSTGGQSFLPNVRISAGTTNAQAANNGIDLGDYTGLDFANGVFYPTWADNSNSTGDNPNGALSSLDMYTARVKVT
jgi:hypothetical protein